MLRATLLGVARACITYFNKYKNIVFTLVRHDKIDQLEKELLKKQDEFATRKVVADLAVRPTFKPMPHLYKKTKKKPPHLFFSCGWAIYICLPFALFNNDALLRICTSVFKHWSSTRPN